MRRGIAALALAAAVGAWTAPCLADQYTVGDRTYKRLMEAQELIEQEQYEAARAVLDELSEKRINDYERALMHQIYGALAAEQDDLPGAALHFERALAFESLPQETQVTLLFNVGQLYLATERFDRAVRSLEVWFHMVQNPNPGAYYILAAAYYQSGKPEKALRPAQLAVELADEPKEAWLQLLVTLHIEKKDYAAALPHLERLATTSPKKAYWIQLAALYAELGQEQKSLAVQQLAYEQGVLTESTELQRLAQMYLYHDLPFRAARVMTRGFEDGVIEPDEKSYKLLADAWLASREYERAVIPLERAAELAPTGDHYSLLARIHMESAHWSDAVEALELALRKGTDDPGAAQLLLGISHFNDRHFARARDAFTRATHYESTRESAVQWLNHLEQEERQQS